MLQKIEEAGLLSDAIESIARADGEDAHGRCRRVGNIVGASRASVSNWLAVKATQRPRLHQALEIIRRATPQIKAQFLKIVSESVGVSLDEAAKMNGGNGR